jgi:type I restriction enzyme S subunit
MTRHTSPEHRHRCPVGLSERIIAYIHESLTLAALRYALLPRLISGEMRLKEAENFLGMVI